MIKKYREVPFCEVCYIFWTVARLQVHQFLSFPKEILSVFRPHTTPSKRVLLMALNKSDLSLAHAHHLHTIYEQHEDEYLAAIFQQRQKLKTLGQ